MAKVISNIDLSHILCRLLIDKDSFDTGTRFHAFMTDAAKLVADHCGGEVAQEAASPNGFPFVHIQANDSLPEDGGIWKTYDLEGDYIGKTSPVEALKTQRHQEHKTYVIPKNSVMLDENNTDVMMQVYFPSLIDQDYDDFNDCPQWRALEQVCSYTHTEVADIIVHVASYVNSELPPEVKPIVQKAYESGVIWILFHLGQ